MMEVVVTTGATRRGKLQSDLHHQQINTQLFAGRKRFLSPSQQCHSTFFVLGLRSLDVLNLQLNMQSAKRN